MFITDIDECQDAPCEQHCINTVGSFNCTCDDGFLLSANGASCDGKFRKNIYSHFLHIKAIQQYFVHQQTKTIEMIVYYRH